MDINEIRAFTGKMVTLQLRTPWVALMYQPDPRSKPSSELACTLAVTQENGQLAAYGPQQFLPNVKLEIRAETTVEPGVEDKHITLEHLVVIQRGPDGSVMEILCPPEEVTFVTRIVEKPPEQGRILVP